MLINFIPKKNHDKFYLEWGGGGGIKNDPVYGILKRIIIYYYRYHGFVENASDIDASVPGFDPWYSKKKYSFYPLNISELCYL
jgi:hypothetical protein